jgi:hypothetical protein
VATAPTTKPKRATKAKPAAAETVIVVQSIKGFDSDLKCRGFQYEVGKTYTHDGAVKACSSGFHGCDASEHPLSVFGFYAPAGSRFHEVTQGGKLSREVGCSKIASATITIGVEITIGELVKRAWDYVWSRAIKSADAHVTINLGAASATGYQGAASATGTRGAASATGYQGAASATGYQGAASATGYQGAAISSYEGKVCGAIGNALFGIERDANLDIVSVACGIVGRDGIEPDVWYVAQGGKLVRS